MEEIAAEAMKFQSWNTDTDKGKPNIPEKLVNDSKASELILKLAILAPNVVKQIEFMTQTKFKYAICVEVGEELFIISEDEITPQKQRQPSSKNAKRTK